MQWILAIPHLIVVGALEYVVGAIAIVSWFATAHLAVRPELENRNRLTVGFRIIQAIPAVLFAVLVSIVGIVCWFLAIFAVLFTGSWPNGLRS